MCSYTHVLFHHIASAFTQSSFTYSSFNFTSPKRTLVRSRIPIVPLELVGTRVYKHLDLSSYFSYSLYNFQCISIYFSYTLFTCVLKVTINTIVSISVYSFGFYQTYRRRYHDTVLLYQVYAQFFSFIHFFHRKLETY